MRVSREEVERIATLAGLELSDEELAGAESMLSRILDYMARIAEVPVEGVEPMAQPWADATPAGAPLREDEPRHDPAAQELLARAPRREGPWLRVPLVVNRRDAEPAA